MKASSGDVEALEVFLKRTFFSSLSGSSCKAFSAFVSHDGFLARCLTQLWTVVQVHFPVVTLDQDPGMAKPSVGHF